MTSDHNSRILKPEGVCLVLIDVQQKLLPVMQNPEQVVKNCSVLIQTAKALNIPVLWCQQVPAALGPTVPELTVLLEGHSPIDKSSFSCAGDEYFLSAIENTNASAAVLCGIESHVCVFQTAMHLMQKGINVHVIADATSSRTLDNKQIALDRMRAAGAVISSTEMLLFELLQSANHPAFRNLSKLIK
jgi:nicotinamidase-related amidase